MTAFLNLELSTIKYKWYLKKQKRKDFIDSYISALNQKISIYDEINEKIKIYQKGKK